MWQRIAHCLGRFLSRHRYARTMNWYVGPSSTVPRGYLQSPVDLAPWSHANKLAHVSTASPHGCEAPEHQAPGQRHRFKRATSVGVKHELRRCLQALMIGDISPTPRTQPLSRVLNTKSSSPSNPPARETSKIMQQTTPTTTTATATKTNTRGSPSHEHTTKDLDNLGPCLVLKL